MAALLKLVDLYSVVSCLTALTGKNVPYSLKLLRICMSAFNTVQTFKNWDYNFSACCPKTVFIFFYLQTCTLDEPTTITSGDVLQLYRHYLRPTCCDWTGMWNLTLRKTANFGSIFRWYRRTQCIQCSNWMHYIIVICLISDFHYIVRILFVLYHSQ